MCRNKRTKDVYALKLIEKTNIMEREQKFIRDEVLIISQLNHPNVIQFYEVYETKDQLAIMMEKANCSLDAYL